jgi:hypothetical protein
MLDTLLNRQIQLALGVIQFTLFLDEFSLRLLRLRQLFIPRLEHLVEFYEFTGFGLQFGGTGFLRFFGFFGGYAHTFQLELRRHLIGDLLVHRSLGLDDLLFLFAHA